MKEEKGASKLLGFITWDKMIYSSTKQTNAIWNIINNHYAVDNICNIIIAKPVAVNI